MNVSVRMKSRLLFLALLFLALAGGDIWAQESKSRNYASEMAVNADVQADFFRRYPDLEDEREMVTIAARALAKEGTKSRDDSAAAELLARRTRLLLSLRTPEEWNRKAVSLFPELGVKDSKFNKLFLRHYNEEVAEPAAAR